MSRRATRWLIFAVALLTVPMPYFAPAMGVAPVARIVFVASLLTAAFLAEGGDNARLFTLLAWGQALIGAALLFGAAALVAKLLSQVGDQRRQRIGALALMAGLLIASCFEIYRTPLSSRGQHSNLFGLLH